MRVALLIRDNDQSIEWKHVLEVAGASVVDVQVRLNSPHHAANKSWLQKAELDYILCQRKDMFTGQMLRKLAVDMGVQLVSFDWLYHCLMERTCLDVGRHESFDVSPHRNVGERVFIKPPGAKYFELAQISQVLTNKYRVLKMVGSGKDSETPHRQSTHELSSTSAPGASLEITEVDILQAYERRPYKVGSQPIWVRLLF